MKVLIVSVLTLFASAGVAKPAQLTKPQEKICSQLQDQYDNECAHIMCDESINDGVFKTLEDCTSSSDYAEAAQGGCDSLPELDARVKAFNLSHAGANLTCEE